MTVDWGLPSVRGKVPVIRPDELTRIADELRRLCDQRDLTACNQLGERYELGRGLGRVAIELSRKLLGLIPRVSERLDVLAREAARLLTKRAVLFGLVEHPPRRSDSTAAGALGCGLPPCGLGCRLLGCGNHRARAARLRATRLRATRLRAAR